MTTVVPGLIKLGKTGSDNFESDMYHWKEMDLFECEFKA